MKARQMITELSLLTHDVKSCGHYVTMNLSPSSVIVHHMSKDMKETISFFHVVLDSGSGYSEAESYLLGLLEKEDAA